MASTATILETHPGNHGRTYHVKRTRSGAVYCTCAAWKFSKVHPKTCKHLEAWQAKQGQPAPAGVLPTQMPRIALARDMLGTPVYRGDWVCDHVIELVMRAHTRGQIDGESFILATDGRSGIYESVLCLCDPLNVPRYKVLRCDRAGFDAVQAASRTNAAAYEMTTAQLLAGSGPINVGTIIEVPTSPGPMEMAALYRTKGASKDCWAWSHGGIGPFLPGQDRVVGHVADRIADAMRAVSARPPSQARVLYAVICRADRDHLNNSVRGEHELATRQLFATEREAEDYAASISTSRDPCIVEGLWAALVTRPLCSRVTIRFTREPSPGMSIPGYGHLRETSTNGFHEIQITINDYSALRLPAGHPHEHGKPSGHVQEPSGAVFETLDWL